MRKPQKALATGQGVGDNTEGRGNLTGHWGHHRRAWQPNRMLRIPQKALATRQGIGDTTEDTRIDQAWTT